MTETEIPVDKLTNLKNYKYQSTDKSILSKYVLNYWYNYVIERVSLKLAPNTLTLFGFICMFLSCVLTILLDPTLSRGQVHKFKTPAYLQSTMSNLDHISIISTFFKHINILFSWLYFLLPLINGILLFMYQTLDAIDGKQARRLGMSSPLGQLFDHGCDALICFFVAIGISSSLGIGITNLYIFAFNLAMIYYLCNIEEYFTNLFYLGYINGPSEGIFIGYITHFCVFIFKDMFIASKFPCKMFFDAFICYGNIELSFFTFETIIFLTISLLSSIRKIVMVVEKEQLVEVATSILNIFGLFTSIVVLCMNKKNNLIIMYAIYFTFMFVFAKMNLDLSYGHLKKTPFKEISLDFCYFLFIISAPASHLVEFSWLYYIFLCFLCWFSYSNSVIDVITEICLYLGIKCFEVKEKIKTN